MHKSGAEGFGLLALLLSVAVIGLLGAGAYYGAATQTSLKLPLPGPIAKLEIGTTARQVDTPGPLRSLSQKMGGKLTLAGIVQQTNVQRQKEGLGLLTNNQKLNQAAEKKMADMFQQQYFEHESPQGRGPADLAHDVDYQYIRIGENLALGGFKDDQDVVQAWMNSPGHRANILRPNVTEIGVATGTGTFDGKKVWIAVQEFGLPASNCPAPDPKTQKTFDTLTTQAGTQGTSLETEQAALQKELSELEKTAASIKALAEASNQEIEDGNAAMQQGNATYQQTGSEEQAQPYWTKGESLQASGQAKRTQVEQQQQAWTARQVQLQQAQTTYNQKVDVYKQLQAQIKSLEAPINDAIKNYNACITK